MSNFPCLVDSMCPFESASIRSIVDVDWSWCRIVHFLNWLGQICRLISLLNRGGTESLRLLHQRFAIFTGVSASLYGRNRQKFQSNRSSIINFSIQLIKYMKIIFNVALFRAFESYQHLKRSAIKMRCSAVGFFFAAKKKNVLFITFLVFGLNSSPSIPHPFHLEKSGKNGKQCWAATLVHSFNLGGFIQFRVGCQSSFTRPFQTHENRQKKKRRKNLWMSPLLWKRREGSKKKIYLSVYTSFSFMRGLRKCHEWIRDWHRRQITWPWANAQRVGVSAEHWRVWKNRPKSDSSPELK